MRSTPKDIATHLATLRETPVVFSNLAERLTETELRAKAEPKAWSFNEVLAHLSACAEVWGDDIEQILAEETAVLTNPHPNKVMKSKLGMGRTFAEMTTEFIAMRDRLLERLHATSAEHWERGGTFNGRHHTVYSQTRRMALHEEAHVRMIREG